MAEGEKEREYTVWSSNIGACLSVQDDSGAVAHVCNLPSLVAIVRPGAVDSPPPILRFRLAFFSCL